MQSAVFAAEVPGVEQPVDLVAREQPVTDFIAALFREIGVPVSVDDTLEGVVNGRFDGSAGDVLGELAGAFDVIFYHDGSVAHVYRSNELVRKVVPLSRAQASRVLRSVTRMALPDAMNQIIDDDNGVLLIGVPRFIEQVENVVASVQEVGEPRREVSAPPARVEEPVREEVLDADAVTYRVFRLRHAWADDTSFRVDGRDVVVPGVATIVNSLVSDSPVAFGVAEGASTPGGQTLEGLRGQGLAGVRDGATLASGNGAAGSANAPSDGLMRVVADTRLNAVIVRDTVARMPAYEALIDSLDVESHMVEIEATIIDINTARSHEIGVNWRASLDGGDGDILFGEGNESDQALLPGTALITPQGRGGVLSFALGESADFLARIRLLEERGAARVVAKPHVITLSDVEAVLGATTEFFIRVAGLEQVDLFNVPVGTLLRVTPHVFRDGTGSRIKLLVNIEDGSQSAAQVDGIPVVERANISTQAVIHDGDSLLVGGLVRDTYLRNDFRVPFLGSLPVIGRLFRSDSESVTRVERLFMITPRIAEGGSFGVRPGLPRLEGDQSVLLGDAGLRLEALDWPWRDDAPAYWPDSERAVPRSAATQPVAAIAGSGAISAIGRTDTPVGADARADAGVARPARFVSPFTVERWSVDSP